MNRRKLIGAAAAVSLGGLLGVVGFALFWGLPDSARDFSAGSQLAVAVPEDRLFDPELAQRVFPPLRRGGRSHRFDPVAGLVNPGNFHREREWAEHPRGSIVYRTNESGFREDEPTELEKTGLRVFVTGDSHTFGIVNNDETFASVLEGLLRSSEDSRSVDVINAGVAFTGPYCYYGMTRKWADLDPDVVVATVFLGNDFWDDYLVNLALSGRSHRNDGSYLKRITAAADRWRGPVSQGFNQIYRFKHYPKEVDLALDCVVSSFGRMQAFCEEHGIRLVVLILPTKMDVDLTDDRDVFEAVRDFLGLTEDDLSLNRQLGERLVAELRERGIRCIDPTEQMQATDTPLYWRQDYHLNVAGNELIGRVLYEDLREIL